MKQLTPLTLKAFLLKNPQVTVRQIQMYFQADQTMLSYLLSFWKVAGQLAIYNQCGGCQGCLKPESLVESFFDE
jgi:hypothetical protein